jgi:hypothetical protein
MEFSSLGNLVSLNFATPQGKHQRSDDTEGDEGDDGNIAPIEKGKGTRPKNSKRKRHPASNKAKGRRLQQLVRDTIKAKFHLPDSDVVSTSMGVSGMDIQLSARAREVFGYATECKNCESLNIHRTMEQCETNAKQQHLQPLAVFSKNRGHTYAVIRFAEFMRLLPTAPNSTLVHVDPEEADATATIIDLTEEDDEAMSFDL